MDRIFILLGAFLFLVTEQASGSAQVANSTVPLPSDCSEIYKKDNNALSGVYTIQPDTGNADFQAYCKMSCGGWTVMQKRLGNPEVNFRRSWMDYEHGFGELNDDHWLGLLKVSLLTHQANKQCQLKIVLTDFSNNTACAAYGSFVIGTPAEHYQLKIGNYSGTAGDSFKGSDEKPGSNQYNSYFSTYDKYYGGCSPFCLFFGTIFETCAVLENSGWWFNDCKHANLNGNYRSSPNLENWASSLFWPTMKPSESLKSSEMLVQCN